MVSKGFTAQCLTTRPGSIMKIRKHSCWRLRIGIIWKNLLSRSIAPFDRELWKHSRVSETFILSSLKHKIFTLRSVIIRLLIECNFDFWTFTEACTVPKEIPSFWNITLCNTVEVNRCFREIHDLHLQGGNVSQRRNQHEAGSKLATCFMSVSCLAYSSTPKMEAIRSTELTAAFHTTTRH
jgi:hypothetical protein